MPEKKNRRHRTCEICCSLGLESEDASFFKFPNDPVLRQKWVQFCELQENDLTQSAYLCSLHFRENQIIKRADRCVLVKGAVPVIFDFTWKLCTYKHVESPVETQVLELNVESQTEMPSLDSNAKLFSHSNTEMDLRNIFLIFQKCNTASYL